ncbi:hypothetical protein B5F75_03915 [Candidatus Avelusimicrobium gallicola]|uniref:Uncharacterized protein n=1 Tax=Candidatus Avelusimicrobium gallicola TaxID=2562704 RepID=A0A1Y4DEE0_9BACT|nr:hypothetical protein B5F75_03915 [Elusimicrobium sp. An273]
MARKGFWLDYSKIRETGKRPMRRLKENPFRRYFIVANLFLAAQTPFWRKETIDILPPQAIKYK